jgi:hypothetical protein
MADEKRKIDALLSSHRDRKDKERAEARKIEEENARQRRSCYQRLR